MRILTSLAFLFISVSASAAIDYPAPVKSAKEARETRALRAQKIIDQFAAMPVALPPVPPKAGFFEFITTNIAKLSNKTDLEAVSKNIMTESFHPWGVGTDIKIAGSVCARVGDYDFVLMGLIRMAYLDLESGDKLLTTEARHKLRHELLSVTGNDHHVKFSLRNCPFVKIQDSENHIMMTEFSRYLTNQLLFKESGDPKFDNIKNGNEEWLLKHMSEFMRTDFDELNSRPYQGYTLIALGNLVSYAEGQKVKLLGTMILDYLSAKAAVQSKGLRRYGPFRRQLRHRDATNFMETDNGMFWYSFHAGNTEFRKFQNERPSSDPQKEQEFFNDYMYFMAATDKYEIPEMIHELFFDQSTPLFQKIHSRDVEIYYNSPSFLLSAGGRYRKVFGYFTRENDVWPMATVVMPANQGITINDVFAFKGEKEWNKKNNLCVAPGFACGTNLSVPKHIPESCKVKQGPWTFYDLTTCPVKMGFFIATYEDGERGLLEVREPEITFTEFKDAIVKANGQKKYSSKEDNQYITSDGRAIVFDWKTKSLDTYPIKSIDGKGDSDTTKWPYASGNVIESSGDGVITIRNPMTGDRMILDQKEILKPRRSMVK